MTSADDRLLVSIIMPIRNEASFIERCLKSIVDNDYPPDRMEIVVVDGMSDDGTREIVGRFCAESDIATRLVDNPHRIVPHAMNIGTAAGCLTGSACLTRNWSVIRTTNSIFAWSKAVGKST